MKKLALKILLSTLLVINVVYSQPKGDDDILPIQLLYFEGYAFSEGIILRWGTATEINNFGFEVQRADITKIFQFIGFVPGSGNSNSPKHYFFTDTTLPGSGLYFYRLKQIDTDGTIYFLDTIQVLFNPLKVENEQSGTAKKVLLRNNFNKNELEVILTNKEEHDEIEISIFSITGQKVFNRVYNNFYPSLKVNYSNFSSGVYIILINNRKNLISPQKFIVIR